MGGVCCKTPGAPPLRPAGEDQAVEPNLHNGEAANLRTACIIHCYSNAAPTQTLTKAALSSTGTVHGHAWIVGQDMEKPRFLKNGSASSSGKRNPPNLIFDSTDSNQQRALSRASMNCSQEVPARPRPSLDCGPWNGKLRSSGTGQRREHEQRHQPSLSLIQRTRTSNAH